MLLLCRHAAMLMMVSQEMLIAKFNVLLSCHLSPGQGVLENVLLRVEAFDYLKLPFALQEVRVGRLKLQVRCLHSRDPAKFHRLVKQLKGTFCLPACYDECCLAEATRAPSLYCQPAQSLSP